MPLSFPQVSLLRLFQETGEDGNMSKESGETE